MKKTKIETADATIKGAILGVLTYVGAKLELSPEVIAISLPAAAAIVSAISVKIGPKNTALLLKVATKALQAAPAVEAKPAPVAKATKKASPAKKK